MKALISRQTHRPEQHYSGLYQLQGGMVTDADLGEQSDISKQQLTLLGDISIKSGVPDLNGCIFNILGDPELQSGRVVADGVSGEIVLKPATPTGTRSAYGNQADFLLPPALPTSGTVIFFADVWDRVVSSLEDPLLTDFGLHGADTSVRTRTMTQIKFAPVADKATIAAGLGNYPKKGTATIEAALSLPADTSNGCDPCAEEITADARIGNTLFRIEVVAVEGTASQPTQIQLAWSMENAAEQAHTNNLPNGFANKTGAIFELFTTTTEQHHGVFAAGQSPQRSHFVVKNDLLAANATDWPFVRRWDGHTTVNPAVNGNFPGGIVNVDNKKVTISADVLAVTIDFANAHVVTGDYWLIELREFAPETKRVRIVSVKPLGIIHHYVPLFEFDCSSNKGIQLADADRRRLSFPSLSSIPASHVSIDPLCANIYGNAMNVQEALAAVCNIDAEDIKYSGCEKIFKESKTVKAALNSLCDLTAAQIIFTDECALFDGATNVQEAFHKICDIKAEHVGFVNTHTELYDGATTAQEAFDALANRDFSLEKAYRHLFDWGVVCGLTLKRSGEKFIVSPGTFLDRKGRLVTLESPIDIAAGSPDLKAALSIPEVLLTREVCVSLELGTDDKIAVRFTAPGAAVIPRDPTYPEALKDCDDIGFIHWSKTSLNEFAKSAVGNKLLLATALKDATAGAVTLTTNEQQQAKTQVKKLLDDHKANALPEENMVLLSEMAKIDAKYATVPTSVQELVAAEMAKDQLAIIIPTFELMREQCKCDAAFMACPPPVTAVSGLVPIGCIEFTADISFNQAKACMACCRRQALTQRSMRYYFDTVNNKVKELAKHCCSPKDGKNPDGGMIDWGYILGGVKIPKETVLWDPKPKIGGLDPTIAAAVMTGNGVDIVDTIDLGVKGGFDKLVKGQGLVDPIKLLRDGDSINPGDKVAMLVRDNKAVGYAIVERGQGRLLFDRSVPAASIETPATAVPASPGIDLNMVKDLEQKLGMFKTERDAILADFEKLAAHRSAMLKDISNMREETKALDVQRAGMQGNIEIARANFDRIQEEQKTFIDKTFVALPAMTVVGDAALSAKLASAGIKTVDDLVRIDDAKLTTILLNNSQGMTTANLKSLTNKFLTR